VHSGGRRVPRRRGGDSTAAAADSGGEKLGEREEVAVELTEGSFWAGKCRRWELNEEGRSSTRTAMVAATETPDSAGKQLERARGGAEWLRGEVARLQARRIEVGWRALAGATNDDGPSSSLRYA